MRLESPSRSTNGRHSVAPALDAGLPKRTEILQTIFDHIPAMIALIDSQGRFLAVNAEWERVLGWCQEEVLGRSDLFAKMLPDPPELERGLNFIVTADGTWSEFQLTTPNGIIDTIWTNRHLSDGRIIAFGQDITERKRTEEALVEAREQLEKAVERDYADVNTYGLTFRELTVLHLVAAGKTDAEIARLLGISMRTAQAHLAKILLRMKASTRTEASVRAVREGLIR